MDGEGAFTFPHGVVYEGQFRDGMFHGKGILIYPQGQAMNCTFQKGKLTQWEFLFGSPEAAQKPDSNDDFNYGGKKSWYPDSESSLKFKTSK